MDKYIIGIHGLANKPGWKEQREGWQKALNEGLRVNELASAVQLDDAQFVDVYWANHLYKNALHRDVDFRFDEHYDDEPYYEAQPPALKEYRQGIFDALRGRGQDAMDFLFDKLPEDLTAKGPLAHLMTKLVRDLAFYYDPKCLLAVNPDEADSAQRIRKPAHEVLKYELREILGKYLRPENQVLLIAHSMGSIIAYDVLTELAKEQPSMKLHALVTIGSPLGLPLVKRHATHDKSPARTPSNVETAWINFADRRDPVAADTHLRGDYAANDAGVRVVDDLVWNDYEYGGKKNPHKIFGYLRTPEMSRLIRLFLTGDQSLADWR
ncbi:MAG: hypothetical protein HYV16_14715 [Gammaproteobacteria bacterium]|nr:hypothetical protein [Gammaproteobacteria bacterium]